MSLRIDVDKVNAVLLDDGWHSVAKRSFTIDSYEFFWTDGEFDPNNIEGWNEDEWRDRCTQFFQSEELGFAFDERAAQEGAVPKRISGPMSAIKAVRSS